MLAQTFIAWSLACCFGRRAAAVHLYPQEDFFLFSSFKATKCSALLPQSPSENPLPNKVTFNAIFNTSLFCCLIVLFILFYCTNKN